ncbi:hemolysin activator protein [Fusobacterium animalis D11]|uniref:Hemolysin activator protein n=1 Tax=Fusobacterium animalis D11 TaxID=556264 RepID=D6BHQ8_9FUSO|nr:POTRA domain-containing protein [Fusobacterium nucleatum]EFD81705.1 hemolysin activator protein [Fusobacterium animalis D11]
MMFRKIFLLSILIFSFSYAVDEIDIKKRRQEQQDFDNLIRNQNFSVSKNNEDNGQKNLILNVTSIDLEGNTIFEDFQIDAILRKYIGKNKNIYALINELENKYIERGYVTTKVGLNTEKSDFENGNISLFILERKIDKVFYDDKENEFKTFITFPQRELFFQKMN